MATPHILLRSSWQTVNIGDIGHTPGMLRLLERYIPEAQVTLWPRQVDRGVREMLLKTFPRLKIVEGALDANGRATTLELEEAWNEADFLLHGSGPSLVAATDLVAWRKSSSRPFGALGVTVENLAPPILEAIPDMAFLYTRDTISLANLEQLGARPQVADFAPDATFAIDLRDDTAAEAYLAETGLKTGEFVCFIPRLRYTPYYQIRQQTASARDLERAAISAQFKEQDHARLRGALEIFVRTTSQQVLVCPEMTYEVAIGKELLVDPLPGDIREHVVWRDRYWNVDEAASVYARSRGIASFEMHSPIICAAMGIPAIHIRQPTDTCKGQMWRDVGFAEWMFEVDEATPEAIAEQLLGVWEHPEIARDKVASAMNYVNSRHDNAFTVFRHTLAGL